MLERASQEIPQTAQIITASITAMRRAWKKRGAGGVHLVERPELCSHWPLILCFSWA
jgi:hypothetical protein